MSSGTPARVLTAAILIPIVVAADWYGPNWLIAAMAAIVGVLALREFFALGDARRISGLPCSGPA